MSEEKGEKMELRHDPVPGYRTILIIALAAGVAYMGLIFCCSL